MPTSEVNRNPWPTETLPRKRETVEQAVIRFCGDSGDGMQITGSQFTNTAALFGNDLATFPDFPAEIRAPAGTLPGVSGFQINFSSQDVFTPGDTVDVLVAMNPAALKMNIADLKHGRDPHRQHRQLQGDRPQEGAGHAPTRSRTTRSTATALFPVDLTKLTRAALRDLGLDAKSMDRCKNFFALGMCYWLYNRPMDATLQVARRQVQEQAGAGRGQQAGHEGGLRLLRRHRGLPGRATRSRRPSSSPGIYRNISGNTALALGFVAAAQQAGLPLFQGSYPITPASDILHELSMYKEFGVMTFQAEDEIAAITSAIGAAYGGALGVTTTSGPGMALKMEAIGPGHRDRAARS